MTLVRIVRNWTGIDLLRQTPGSSGTGRPVCWWQDVRFTLDEVVQCDYLLISNFVPRDIEVVCPPEHVWSIVCEPPQRCFRRWHTDLSHVHRIYTTWPDFQGTPFVHDQPALPWHVNKNYDELVSCPCPTKWADISWVTSNKTIFGGHKARVRFLERIRSRIDFDLYGRGFRAIEDKWDALAPYRYSFAVENSRTPDYWTEKIADCFLAWTMPIYCGCPNITDYFPEEAMIRIDIDDANAGNVIRDAVASNAWRRNLDAIAHARELVLNKYQLFPLMVERIQKNELARSEPAVPQRLTVHDIGSQPAQSTEVCAVD